MSNVDTNRIAVAEIAELGRKSVEASIEAIEIDDLGYGLPASIPVFMSQGNSPESLRQLIEEWRQCPQRWEGTAQVTSLQSFIDLTKRHQNDKNSVIFANTDPKSASLTSVIDYNDDNRGPTFRKHRVSYRFPLTDDFKSWINGNAISMKQSEFAEFLEDHVHNLSAPTAEEKKHFKESFNTTIATPMDLVTLSRGLSINVEQRVASHSKLQSGEAEISFIEEHTNGKGEALVIPGLFMIALPAFDGSDPIRVAVRLRYRVSGGAVVWQYHLYRWEDALKERIISDMAQAAKETGLPAFEGTPEI